VSVVIRPMAVDDLPAVYKLGLECYDVTDKPYNYWTIREVADHVEGSPGLCFVADDDGDVVGFALGAESYEVLEDTGHLEWVAVAPSHRRQGIASRLLATAVDAFRELGKSAVVADVASTNAASHALAAGAGFTEGISVTFFTRRLS
jgi:ribosomal protein S18 acetylase RimI-like enzyme